MVLLDLPPELFQRIIAIYATTVSASRAARTRTVSSEIHGLQVLRFSKLTSARNLLQLHQ